MIIAAMLIVAVIAVGVFLAWGLRGMVFSETATEKQLHRPGAHTLEYAVPNGQDPSVLIAALGHAGFTAVTELRAGNEVLVVECEESQRRDVRSIIEDTRTTTVEGGQLAVGAVRFEDER